MNPSIRLLSIIVLILQLFGCATTIPPQVKVEDQLGEMFKGFSISKKTGSIESISSTKNQHSRDGNFIMLYLKKNGDAWEVSSNGDLKDQNTELLIIDFKQKTISLGVMLITYSRDRDYVDFKQRVEDTNFQCKSNLISSDASLYPRNSDQYHVCSSSLKKLIINANRYVGKVLIGPLYAATTGQSLDHFEIADEAIKNILLAQKDRVTTLIQQRRSEIQTTNEINAAKAKADRDKWEREKPEREKAAALKSEQLKLAEAQNIKLVKTIGQKICSSFEGTYAPQIGTVMGVPNYARPESKTYYVSAFTEGVSGNRIQIRVAGIQMLDYANKLINVENLGGEVVYKPGILTWVNAESWKPCK